MTDDLATALHTMADSGQPPAMDVERVLHKGRHSLFRRRMTALGGGTAVLAVTALAVGSLTGMGSGVSDTNSPTSSTTYYTVNPHDPVVVHWQFGHVPSGMVVYGGVDPTDEQMSTMLVSENSRFLLELVPMEAPIVIDGNPRGGGPTERVSVKVPGTTKAYWEGFRNGRIANTNGEGGQMATLDMQLKSGQWMSLIANNIEARADWKSQILKSAASVVHQDRSVPMPFQVAGTLPKSFIFRGGSVLRKSGTTNADIMYRLGTKEPVEDIVSIGVSTTDVKANSSDTNPYTKSVCKDSKGLTVCVSYPKTEPAELKAIGGPQALLDRVTSLGNDPANWTTDVIR